LKIGILFIVWYRARVFSVYYVRMVKRSAEYGVDGTVV